MAVLLAMVLGFGAALTPGPSLALTSANTVRGGVRSGAASALAASTADLAIAVVGIVILSGVGDRLASFFGVIGGVMLLAMGLDAIASARRSDAVPHSAASHRRFWRAAVLELGLPQALLFGLTVVAPIITHVHNPADGWPWLLGGVLAASLTGARLGVVAQVARHGRPIDRLSYRRVCWVIGPALAATGIGVMVWLGANALGV